MTAELLVQEVIGQINGQAFSLAFRFIVIGVIVYMLKLLVESLANYFLFRYNKYVGLDTEIEIYGKRGIVKHVGYTRIIIETDEGDFHIPMKDWKCAKYTVLKNK